MTEPGLGVWAPQCQVPPQCLAVLPQGLGGREDHPVKEFLGGRKLRGEGELRQGLTTKEGRAGHLSPLPLSAWGHCEQSLSLWFWQRKIDSCGSFINKSPSSPIASPLTDPEPDTWTLLLVYPELYLNKPETLRGAPSSAAVMAHTPLSGASRGSSPHTRQLTGEMCGSGDPRKNCREEHLDQAGVSFLQAPNAAGSWYSS